MSRSVGMTKSLRQMTAFLSDPTSHWRGHEGLKWVEPRPGLSIGCGFRKETIAGMRRNGRDAPIAVIYRSTACRPPSTHLRTSCPRQWLSAHPGSGHSPQTLGHAGGGPAHVSSSSSAFASFRLAVSKPSVNHAYTGARRSWASARLPCSPHSLARLVAARSS